MTHEEKVKNISSQVRARGGEGQPVKLQKKAVSHFVPNPYDKRGKLPKIDLSSLNDIITIDQGRKLCVAEPGATFSDIVQATMKYNLIPMTVPELKGITIGGAVSGCSIESMSYKYGGFHDSAVEYEIVSGKGDVIICSPAENSDIFHMIHASYGTLGILTKLTFKLIPARPYVKMTYRKFGDFDSFWAELQERCKRDDHDFVDAIVHSPKLFTLCLGDMVDSAPYASSYDWMNIFYKSTAKLDEDYLKIYDYLFRYDTECHWLTKTFPLLENKCVRFLFGKFYLGSTNLIKWSGRLKGMMKMKRRPEVVVDTFIPRRQMENFYKWYEKDFVFYPLWIIPYRAPEIYPWIDKEYGAKMGDGFFIDCAIYGKRNSEKNKDYAESLERKTFELGGLKALISANYYDEKTFWKIFNRSNYSSAKKKMDPNGVFSDLYNKFKPENYFL